jgi:nucleotide-binding universal stress UspA family protein
MDVAKGEIIVAIDFGEPSIEAARWTANHLARGGQLVLAHAIYAPSPPSFLRGLYPAPDELIEDAKRGAEVRLRELAQSIGRGDAEVIVQVGRPDEVLAKLARDRGAELLVIGAHGQRQGVWKLLGSTAERVVRRGPGSVLLARGIGDHAPRRVMLAIDESESRHIVLAWGTRFAEQGAEIIAVTIVNPLVHGSLVVGAAVQERLRAEQQIEESTREWLLNELRAAKIEGATLHVAFGDAGFEVLSAVKRFNADLLVLGRHGAGGTSGPFMGSVPEFLLRNGTGPVLAAAS